MFRFSTATRLLGRTVSCFVCLAWLTLPARGEELPQPLRELQGTFERVKVLYAGEDIPADKFPYVVILEQDELILRFVGNMTGKDRVSKVTVDATKTPGRMDIAAQYGKSPKTAKAIYKLEDDLLTICHFRDSGEAPTEFRSDAGMPTDFLVLRRQKADEVQAFFQVMEQKILRSKTIQSKLAITVDRGAAGVVPPIEPRTVGLEGKFLVAGERQLLVQLDGKLAQQTERVSISSDGKTLRLVDAGIAKDEGAALPHLAKLTKVAMARTGIFVPIVTATLAQPVGELKEFEIDAAFPMSNLKMGPKVKGAEIETQVVEYDVAVKGAASAPFHVTTWIDIATHLPVRRTITLDAPGEHWSVTESYSELRLGEAIEDREFTTPK